MDGHSAQKTYPRAATTSHTPSDVKYDPNTGLLKFTLNNHGFLPHTYIKIADNSLAFSCKKDTHRFTPTGVDYNPTTGDMVLEFGVSHGLIPNHDMIKITPESITLTCEFNSDGNTTPKSYPRASGTGANAGTPDAAYDVPVTITDTTKTSITINVGTSSDTSEHRFDSATSGALISGGGYTHTFTGAANNSVNRAQVLSGGNYIHTFVSSPGGGVSKKRDRAFDTSIPVVGGRTGSF